MKKSITADDGVLPIRENPLPKGRIHVDMP